MRFAHPFIMLKIIFIFQGVSYANTIELDPNFIAAPKVVLLDLSSQLGYDQQSLAPTLLTTSLSSEPDLTTAETSTVASTTSVVPWRSVEDVLAKYGPDVRNRLNRYFELLPPDFTPIAMKLVAIKADKRMEIWLQNHDQQWQQLRSYPVLGASGSLRPKMREGDLQVPEGVYKISLANPNSNFHLSLKVDYPNEMDRYYARLENRTQLGDNIFIHGSDQSTGCLAIGNRAMEELFVLAHDIGLDNIKVVISPTDPRKSPLQLPSTLPEWINEKYQEIELAIAQLSVSTSL